MLRQNTPTQHTIPPTSAFPYILITSLLKHMIRFRQQALNMPERIISRGVIWSLFSR